jgi:7-cyano-7-deazaguanine synthase
LIDLYGIMLHFKSDLMLSGGEIPEGHYEAESMRRTVVPGRNSIFASILLGVAQSEGAEEIWLGIHAGDHFIYPDCRPEWVTPTRQVIRVASNDQIDLWTPFLQVDKSDILLKGFTLGVPYQLTRTCYKDQAIACGRCGSCQERLAAFRKIGREDPIEYEFRGELSK